MSGTDCGEDILIEQKHPWEYIATCPEREKKLQQTTGAPEHLLRILLSRGLNNEQIVSLLNNPPYPGLLPWQFPGIKQAVLLLCAATESAREILIVNQPDIPGLFAAGLLARVCNLLGSRWTPVHLHNNAELLLNRIDKCTHPPLVIFPVSIPSQILDSTFLSELEQKQVSLILLETCFPAEALDSHTIRIHPPEQAPQITLSGLALKLGEALLFTRSEWYNRRILIYDLETTGLKPERERIIELAGIKAVNGEVVGEFQSLANPGIPLPPIITELTGITAEDLQDAPAEAIALQRFIEFGADAEAFSGHNIRRFDNRFLEARCKAFGYPQFHRKTIDTLELSRRYLHNLTNHKLATVAAGIDYRETEWHRALADVKASMQILYYCLLSAEREITALRRYAGPLVTVNALLALHVTGENRYFLKNFLDRDLFNSHPLIHSLLKQIPGDPGINWTRRHLLIPLTLLEEHHQVMFFNTISAGSELSAISRKEIETVFETNKADRRELLEQFQRLEHDSLPVYRLPNRPLSYLTALDRMLEMISPNHLLLSPRSDGTVIGQLTAPDSGLLDNWQTVLEPGEITDKTAASIMFAVNNKREHTFLQQIEQFAASSPLPQRIKFSTRIQCREERLCPLLAALERTGPYGHDFPAPLLLLEEVPVTVINESHPPSVDLGGCRLVFHSPAWRSIPTGQYLLDLLVRYQGGDSALEYHFFTVDFRSNPFFSSDG